MAGSPESHKEEVQKTGVITKGPKIWEGQA